MMVLSLGSGTMGANHSTSLMGTKPNAPSASEAALKAWEGQLVVARLIVFYLLQIFNIYKLLPFASCQLDGEQQQHITKPQNIDVIESAFTQLKEI